MKLFCLKIGLNYQRINVVGVPGLEPGTSWSQTMRASQLRHTPIGEGKRRIQRLCGVGSTRLELVTSTMSTWRSNQLS
jgi:hypothetical protein